MRDETSVFQARDAFTYVDLYRRLKNESSDYVTRQKQKLMEHYWNVQEAPTRYWAELRAHEHALDWIKQRREPALVVLGEADAEGNPLETPTAAAARQCQAELRGCHEEVAGLQRKVHQFAELQQEWQAERVRAHQESAGLKRRLSQTQSTSVVVGLTLLVVILIQFGLLVSR